MPTQRRNRQRKNRRNSQRKKNRRNSQRGGIRFLGFNFFENAEEKAKREADEKAKRDSAPPPVASTSTSTSTSDMANFNQLKNTLEDSGFAGGKPKKSKKSNKKRSNKKR